MTVAGRIEQMGVNISSATKPSFILAWQQSTESRHAVREIGRAVASFEEERKDLAKRDLPKLMRAHGTFEANIEKALGDLEKLSMNTFIEFTNLRQALLKQKAFFNQIQPSLQPPARAEFQRKMEANIAKYKGMMRKISNLAITSLQNGL